VVGPSIQADVIDYDERATGERKEKTEWHRIVVFNENLVRVIENYVKKGSKIRVRVSASMPTPVSLTASMTWGPGGTPTWARA